MFGILRLKENPLYKRKFCAQKKTCVFPSYYNTKKNNKNPKINIAQRAPSNQNEKEDNWYYKQTLSVPYHPSPIAKKKTKKRTTEVSRTSSWLPCTIVKR